jgi:CheY-like chemotaxis protein
MRNPLSQVQLCLDSMTKLSAEADQQRAAEVFGPHLIRGQTAIRRGMQIIDMLMRQVKTGDVDASKFELLGAARTTHKAVDEFAYASEAERSKVNVIILQDFVFRGDETAYIFVLFNLIKNALYYFPLKPTATLTLTVDAYSVRVRDTGPGIPANVQARLFESFQTAGKEEGTGLGLSYCRRTMRSFRGDICFHSVEGDYTEFILLFAHEPKQNTSVTGATKPVIAQSRSIEFLSPLTLQGKTVLIAEDDEMNRDMMKMALQKWGMRVVEAAHGEEVLTQLDANAEVDLVMMDLNMPGLDGAQACKRIRSRVCAYQKVPILILSGNADMEGVQADLGAYANGFATKTGDMEQLHAMMLEALRQTK